MASVKNLSRIGAACKVSRRRFLEGSAALGISLAAAGRISAPARAAGPNKGGHIRIGAAGGSTTDSLDPGTFNDSFMRLVSAAFRNNLVEIDPSGNAIGELAETWETSPDAARWTFKLRKDVEFHNGKTLDSADVVASLNYHRGPNTKSAAKALMDQISDIEAEDPDTVVITLESGNADLAAMMSDYHLNILPAKDGAIDPQDPVGTGGYVLDAFDPGVRADLKRNPNYWKEGRAHFDSAEVLGIADPTARSNALVGDSVDVINRVNFKIAELLAKRPDVKVEEITGSLHYTSPMLTDTPPFDDNNVRLALKYSVDRQALVDTILRGHGQVGNDNPIGPAYRYFAADLPQREFDPDKARFHLKQAGLSNLKVQLSAADSAFDGAVDTAVLYREHAAKAGIDIEVVREPNDGYWSNVWKQKPWCMAYWAGRPTADWMFSQEYAADAPENDMRWKHPRFNELLVAARAELDEAKRREMYREMQLIVRDEGGVLIPMFANYIWATSDKVAHGEEVAANYDLDGEKVLERWWFT
jgi:peptide/nickel transport system substrate-binding protein